MFEKCHRFRSLPLRENLSRAYVDCGRVYTPTAKGGPISEFCSRPYRMSFYYRYR